MNKRHETRAYEVRAAESPLVIEGTAIVFDQSADMHGFSERIARSALEHVDCCRYRHTGSAHPGINDKSSVPSYYSQKTLLSVFAAIRGRSFIMAV